MAEYRRYTRKVDPSFAWTEHKKDTAKAAKKAARRKEINAIVDKYMPGLKTHGMAFDLGPEEKMAMDKELKRYGTTYDEEIWRNTKSRASKPKNVKSMGDRQAERRAAARNAPSRGMSLAQLEKMVGRDRGVMPPWLLAEGPMEGAPGRFGKVASTKMPGAEIADLLDTEFDGAYPGVRPGKSIVQQGKQRMAQKLLKGGGSIRLPQMSKAMLPMMLLALLAGGMGMGGNEDLDGLLG